MPPLKRIKKEPVLSPVPQPRRRNKKKQRPVEVIVFQDDPIARSKMLKMTTDGWCCGPTSSALHQANADRVRQLVPPVRLSSVMDWKAMPIDSGTTASRTSYDMLPVHVPFANVFG